MNLSYFFTVIVLGLAATSLRAQTTSPINTVPEGITTFQIPQSSGPLVCYFSAPLVSDPIYTGAVSSTSFTAVTGVTLPNGSTNTVSVGDTPPPWTTTLPSAATPYFVKFLSGNEAGRVLQVLSNTNSSLTLDVSDNTAQQVPLNTTNFDVAAGDTFEVFPGDTLALMFGANTAQSPLVLTGGSVITADSVSIFSPGQNQLITYYFNTTSGFWVQSGKTANANNAVIRPYTAFLINRRAGQAATSFVLTGRVAEVNHVVKTTGSGAVAYDSSGYPVDVTLAQLQLQLNPNWVEGTSITADNISIWNPGENAFDTYYEETNNTWRKSGGNPATDESGVVIPAATTVVFTKRSGVSGSTSFLKPVLPYSLTN